MKKFLFLLFILAYPLHAQDNFLFKIFNPTLSISQFSAGLEDASGIVVNPAVLGLEQTDGISFNTTMYKNRIFENSIFLNGKILNLGFGMNFKKSSDSLKNNSLYSIGYGIGFGNENLAFGFSVDYVWMNKKYSDIKSFYNLGIILRPIRYVSFSYSLLNAGWKNIAGRDIGATNIFGLGIRPLGTNRISIFLDYEYDSNLKLKEMPLKYGAELKIINGLFASASIYDQRMMGKNYVFGLKFNFPQIGLNASNILTDERVRTHTNIGFNITRTLKPSILKGKKKIAEVTIEGEYNDYDEKWSLFSKYNKGLQTLIKEIDRAAEDDDIGGLLLYIKNFTTSYAIFGMNAGLEELVAAVNRVKAKGKPVVAFIESMGSVHELYLASSANKIVMPQYGMLLGYGISYNDLKFKYALKKLGIDIRTYTAGKYKSSLSSLSDTLSPAKIEELNSIIDDLYLAMVQQIKTNRNISGGTIDTLSGIFYPQQAKDAGIIDAIGWYEDAKKEIYKLVYNKEIEKGEKVRTLKLEKRKYWKEYWATPDKIAVIGIYGTIVQGESQPPSPIPIPFLSSARSTGSKTVIRQLEKAVKDRNVKAIILRVDSPGGDGIASDDIYRAVLKAKEKKPVVVSMGSLAASGGYYVAAHGATIFANSTTLTGSIGVISQIPFLYDLFQKYDVYTKSFSRGSFSDYFNIYAEPKPEAEKMLSDALNNFYDGFIKRISEGRKLSEEEVRLVAQGRIWTGNQAKDRKLIDHIGGLKEAVEYVKNVAKIKDDYEVEYYSVPGQVFGLGSIMFNLLK